MLKRCFNFLGCVVGSAPLPSAQSQPAPREAHTSFCGLLKQLQDNLMLSLVPRLKHLALFPYKPPTTAIPADVQCPLLLVHWAPVLQHPVLLALRNECAVKWLRITLQEGSKSTITTGDTFECKWPKNSNPGTLFRRFSVAISHYENEGKKRKKTHFPWLDLTDLQRWRKRWQKVLQAALYLFLSPTSISCPAAAASNSSSTAARLGTGEDSCNSYRRAQTSLSQMGSNFVPGTCFCLQCIFFRWGPS